MAAMPYIYGAMLDKKNTNICYTTFETSQLPQGWVDSLSNNYQACIVPHTAIKKVFVQSGISIPIFVVHQGYTRLPRLPHLFEKSFTIGFLGVPQARKNLHKLFGACKDLIHNGQIPELKLTIHVATYYDELDHGWFEEMKQADFVTYSEGKKNERELGEWYAKLSAYCFPSSGEGWSFTPRESLYLGIPTILSDIPVHRELINSGYCQPIANQGLEAAVYDHYENGKRRKITYGQWHCIQKKDIQSAIFDVYQNYSLWKERAQLATQWIAQQWKNEDCLSKVKKVVNQL